MKLTAAQLVGFIARLPKNTHYHYVNERNKGLIVVDSICKPEGPIYFRRYNPEKGGTPKASETESISEEMLWRVANAISEGVPFNIDRIVGASYNTRSVLETLIANTPQFYMCYPGRVQRIADKETIKKGHKHLVWLPNEPHKNGVVIKKDVGVIISEIPSREVVYESISFETFNQPIKEIEIERRHAQIQVALFLIGMQLGYRTWIAKNDKGILYQNKRICEFPGVIGDLHDEQLLKAYDEAITAALLIDCIWFKNGRLMPAVMEVEHSTGVLSGLTRMRNFMDKFPPFPTRYVIVAADENRAQVMKAFQQFKPMNPKFFSYSAVEELYSLCSRRKITGITEEFLDCFMESAS